MKMYQRRALVREGWIRYRWHYYLPLDETEHGTASLFSERQGRQGPH